MWCTTCMHMTKAITTSIYSNLSIWSDCPWQWRFNRDTDFIHMTESNDECAKKPAGITCYVASFSCQLIKVDFGDIANKHLFLTFCNRFIRLNIRTANCPLRLSLIACEIRQVNGLFRYTYVCHYPFRRWHQILCPISICCKSIVSTLLLKSCEPLHPFYVVVQVLNQMPKCFESTSFFVT